VHDLEQLAVYAEAMLRLPPVGCLFHQKQGSIFCEGVRGIRSFNGSQREATVLLRVIWRRVSQNRTRLMAAPEVQLAFDCRTIKGLQGPHLDSK
jgi:hypothetical protein